MDLEQNKICIGIDLGTTNTSANMFYVGVNGQPKLIDIAIKQRSYNAKKRDNLLPSVLYRKSNGVYVVGNEAIDLKENDIRGCNSNTQKDIWEQNKHLLLKMMFFLQLMLLVRY